MDLLDVIQHPGLQQLSSYDIEIEKPLQSINLSLQRVNGMHCNLISSVACIYKIELALLLFFYY